MIAQFNVPSVVIIGGGASKEAGVQGKRLKAKRALLVTDTYMEKSGLAKDIARTFEKEGISTATFPGVQPDPMDKNVLEGLRQLREAKADMVVGLGGGSSIDAAKAISVLVNNELPLSQYAGLHKVPHPGVPLVAIPTTAGTGSEVTKVAVITDTERDVKMMILDVNLLPSVALVDYELTMTMPPLLTSHVGVDTLVHAVEAYVSKKANPLTDPLALSAIRLISENLYAAYKDPSDRKAREAMTVASCQAGMAFANSSVCLVHGMSRPIGAVYHLTHGLSNAVLFPAVTRFSLAGAPERYATVARIMGFANEADSHEKAGQALVKGLGELNEKLGIPRLGDAVKGDLSLFDKKVEKMARDALASGSPNNNPIVPDVRQVIDLYHQAW
jgi:alcohol dehydrogenase class IV